MCIRDSPKVVLDVCVINHPRQGFEDWQRVLKKAMSEQPQRCLLYTSDAADERSSVDLGGRRIIKKKIMIKHEGVRLIDVTRLDRAV